MYAKTAKRRKELSQERIDKLNKIGFHWSLEELNDKNWENNFSEIEKFIFENNTFIIPATVNGKNNTLYTWLRNQKKAIQKGKLSASKFERLISLGVLDKIVKNTIVSK